MLSRSENALGVQKMFSPICMHSKAFWRRRGKLTWTFHISLRPRNLCMNHSTLPMECSAKHLPYEASIKTFFLRIVNESEVSVLMSKMYVRRASHHHNLTAALHHDNSTRTYASIESLKFSMNQYCTMKHVANVQSSTIQIFITIRKLTQTQIASFALQNYWLQQKLSHSHPTQKAISRRLTLSH